MNTMRHVVITYLLFAVQGACSQVQDPKWTASLQRGAQVFMNYCSGCHSLQYLRYNRMAIDLGLITVAGQVDEDLLKNNLIFTQATVYDPIKIVMPATDAQQWFGVVPPDLSLVAREKGRDWLYRYLTGFYNDNSRPFGVNNILVPNVAMPNMLESLTGSHALVSGQLTPQAQEAVNDLLVFLTYVAEPTQRSRYQLGIVVLIFLSILLIVMLLLWRSMRQTMSYKNKEILEQSNPKG